MIEENYETQEIGTNVRAGPDEGITEGTGNVGQCNLLKDTDYTRNI